MRELYIDQYYQVHFFLRDHPQISTAPQLFLRKSGPLNNSYHRRGWERGQV